MEANEYIPSQVGDGPVINKDGSVSAPDLISVEQAAKLFGGKPKAQEKDPLEGDNPDAPPAKPTTPEEPETPNPSEPPSDAYLKETLKIGGEEKTRSDVIQEMSEYYGLDYSQLSVDHLEKQMNDFLRVHHGVVLAGDAPTLEVDVEQQKRARRTEDEANKKLGYAQREKKRIQDERARLNADKKAFEEELNEVKTLASERIQEDDIYKADGTLDVAKQVHQIEVLQARKLLQKMEKRAAGLTSEDSKITQELAGIEQEIKQATHDRTLAHVEQLQANHPHLKFSESFVDVVRAIEQERDQNHPDFDKYQDIVDILEYAERKGVDPEVAYRRLQPVLTVKPSTNGKPQTPVTETEKVARDVNRRQRTATRFLDGSSSLPARPVVRPAASLGDRLHEAAVRAVGGTTSKAADEAGY